MARGASGPLIIGLAGSIAAGKSTVGQILVERGALHCDGDKLVHRLYDPGTPGFERVVAEFGGDVVGPDGFVDRKLLGAKVFGKPEEMAKLTKAMGSISDAFETRISSWREDLGPDDIGVVEAVNLMEPGYARWCDQTWLIGVTDDVARRRLIENRNMSPEEASQRLASQRPVDARKPGADWVYMNDGTAEALRLAVNTEIERVAAIHRRGGKLASVFPGWWKQFVADARAREALKESGTATEADMSGEKE